MIEQLTQRECFHWTARSGFDWRTLHARSVFDWTTVPTRGVFDWTVVPAKSAFDWTAVTTTGANFDPRDTWPSKTVIDHDT